MALFLCFAMLLGTTFAWFTDSVISSNNIITAGNLDIELYYMNDETSDWEKVDKNTNIFKKDTLWEPGHTEVVKFKIVNEGSLALKYQLGVNVASEVGSVNVNDVEFKLSDFIKFGIVDGAQSYTRDQAIAAAEANGATALNTAYNSAVTSLEAKNDDNTDEKIVTMVVYMPTTVGNEANYKKGAAVPTINLGINLFATQHTAESDSFNDQYDKDAEFSVDVKNADELANVLKVGGKVKLTADISVDKTLEIPAGVQVVLDLNGKTISGQMHKDNGAIVKNNGTLTIVGGTISSKCNNGGSAIANSGTLTVNNATLNGAPNADSSWPSYTVNNTAVMTVTDTKITSYHGAVASYGAGAVVTLNNSEIDMAGIPGFTSHGIYTYNNGSVIVNGGTYANKATDQAASGASVINGAVTVSAGTFNCRIENYSGTPVIKGGTFTVNPNTKFLA
jgi:predicted ribosomally synthesized peptide with SipW-like signal peptide